MIYICYICKKEIDTDKDEYISIANPDGTLPNNETTPRKHFDCIKVLNSMDNKLSELV